MNLNEARRHTPNNIGGMSAEEIKAELKKERENEKKEKERLKREKQKKRAARSSKDYRQYLRDVLQHKKEKFNEQQKQSKEKAAERAKREQEKERGKLLGNVPEPEALSIREPDSITTAKNLRNTARALKGIAKVGISAFIKNRKKRNKNEPPIQKVQVKDVTTPSSGLSSSPQRLLPPGRPSGLPPARPPGLPPSGGGGVSPNSKRQMTGLEKIKAIKKGTYLNKGQVSETYSCWREEFIYELASLRQKSRKRKDEDDKPVDIMRGRNTGRIKLNPNVMEVHDYLNLNETTNGASIFAKATPPMKRRTTPLSDIHLAKQPGKKSVKQVADDMRKLFLGDRAGYYSNYDLSGHASDDNSVDSNKSIKSESYNVKSIAISNQKKRRGF